MARDGIFTKIVYDTKGVVAKEVERKVMIVGAPVYAQDKVPWFRWDGKAKIIQDGLKGQIMDLLRPDEGCKMTATSGTIEVYAKVDGEYYEMTSSRFESPVAIAKGNYNTAAAPIVSFAEANSLFKRKDLTSGTYAVAVSSGIATITAASNESVNFATELLSEVKRGDSIEFSLTAGSAYGMVTEVGDTYIKVDVTDITGIASANVTGLYYDITGKNTKGAPTRNPAIYLTVKAVMTHRQGVYDLSSLEDVVNYFGQSSIANPNSILGYHAALALMAGQTAIRVYAMPTDGTETGELITNSASNHVRALTAISAMDAYYLVPATTTDTVISLYAQHVRLASSIDMKKERRLYCSHQIIKGGEIMSGYAGESYTSLDNADPEIDTLSAEGVPAGFDSERVTIMPMYAFIGEQLIKGSQIAAIVAGYRSSLDVGYVTTLDTIPLITSVPSLEYFSIPQLERLKNAGWYMIVQDSPNTRPYVYHQRTTAQDILEKQEESLVIALDAFAMSLRATLKPFIAKGMGNRISGQSTTAPITLQYLRKVRNGSLGLVNLFVNRKEIFAGVKIVGIATNKTNRDQVDIKLEVQHYYPANRINTAIHVV